MNGHLYLIQWGHHRTDTPPDNMQPVQFRGFALSTHPEDKPPEIDAFFQQHGYGNGWNVYVQHVAPPPRRRSEATKGRLRVNNLERRVAKTIGPLFAQEVVQQTIEQQPDYYAGQGDPAQDARIAEYDAQTQALYNEFLAWAETQRKKGQPHHAQIPDAI